MNDDFCGMFATPGLISSSNSETYVILSFSERLDTDERRLPTVKPIIRDIFRNRKQSLHID